MGAYNLQVSGETFFSGAVEFAGGEISGLAAPTYNSGASNKKYVDDQVALFSANTALVKNGFAQIAHGQTIAHGMGGLPIAVNVTPSSAAVNFGVSCKVDTTNITVYMTAPGTRDIFWEASK